MKVRFAACLLSLVAAAAFAQTPTTQPTTQTTFEAVPVPDAERARLKLAPFYEQYCQTGDFPVVASSKVNPFAMKEAAFLIDQMLSPRPEVRDAMVKGGIRFTIMAVSEMTTDVPEHSFLTPKDFWDRRARGLGATPEAPCVSCGEENLLGLRGDPYHTENILIHEFAHAIHETGMRAVDPTFDKRLEAVFEAAKAEGLWKGTYAMTNRAEYFAEGTQSWFDCNRANDSVHNDIDTREKIKTYDPRLCELLLEVYGDGAWRYSKPATRASMPHLIGFDPSNAPSFTWPERLAAGSPTTRRGRAATTRSR